MKPINEMEVHELLALDKTKLVKCDLEICVARLAEISRKDIGQIIEDESLHREEYQGFVYVLSNPSMPEILKIGVTEGRVDKRMKELSRATGVPSPFKCELKFPVYEPPRIAEKRIHDYLDLWRVSHNREFFRLDTEVAAKLIKEVIAESKLR